MTDSDSGYAGGTLTDGFCCGMRSKWHENVSKYSKLRNALCSLLSSLLFLKRVVAIDCARSKVPEAIQQERQRAERERERAEQERERADKARRVSEKAVSKLIALDLSIEEVADTLGLSVEAVQTILQS